MTKHEAIAKGNHSTWTMVSCSFEIGQLYNVHVGALTHITHRYVFFGVIVWSNKVLLSRSSKWEHLARFGASKGVGKDLLWDVWGHIDWHGTRNCLLQSICKWYLQFFLVYLCFLALFLKIP